MPSRREPIAWTPVLGTLDPGLIAVAKSLLDAAGIPYFARGDALTHAFGGDPPVQLQVPADRAVEAQELLADLTREKKRSRVLQFPKRSSS